MITELVQAIIQAMEFRDIDPNSISKVEVNVGFVWFKSGDKTYFVGIQKADFDLDKHTSKH